MSATAVYLAVGFVTFLIWRWTANDRWIEDFFRIPGALLLTAFAVMELWLSVLVIGEFRPDQPMRRAWKLIAYSAGCDVVSAVTVQVLAWRKWWPASTAAAIREFGLSVGGPFRFALLVAGLAYGLRTYRRARLASRLIWLDWILLSAVALFIVSEARSVAIALRHGQVPAAATVLGWPTDPLLWLLLAEALMLYRSAQQMGEGYIGRCWKALSIGVFLVSLGDGAIWAGNMGILPWPWSALEWYIWLPAAAAFALAPAYQLEAMAHARGPQ